MESIDILSFSSKLKEDVGSYECVEIRAVERGQGVQSTQAGLLLGSPRCPYYATRIGFGCHVFFVGPSI